MPVYIARDYRRKVVDVVLATDKRLANAFWQGKGIYYHSVDEVTEENLKSAPNGILSLVRTKTVRLSEFGRNAEDVLIIDD